MLGLNFSVKRERYSVTQGEAVVYLDQQEVARFHDTLEFINGIWKSSKSDSAFIKGVLAHPYDDLYQVSQPLKKYLIKKHQIQKGTHTVSMI